MIKVFSLIFVLLFCGLLSNCFVDDSLQVEIPENYLSIKGLNVWVFRNIEYVSDIVSKTQSAEETLFIGQGDCEDFAALLIALCGQKLNIYPVMLIIYENGRGHAVVEYEALWYDATYGVVYERNEDLMWY